MLKNCGGAQIEGPFGFRRALGKWDFGEGRGRLIIWVEEDLDKSLKKEFGVNTRSAL